jgi:hypothetical protein
VPKGEFRWSSKAQRIAPHESFKLLASAYYGNCTENAAVVFNRGLMAEAGYFNRLACARSNCASIPHWLAESDGVAAGINIMPIDAKNLLK